MAVVNGSVFHGLKFESVDFDFIENFKEILAAQEDETVALRAGLSLIIRVLDDPSSYHGVKARPHGSYRKMVHYLLTKFRPLKEGFDRRQRLTITGVDGQPWVIKRIVDRTDGKYRIAIPPDGDSNVLAREPKRFQYDLCISFAGEDRTIATEIAKSVHDKWTATKIFLDDFEKWNLWGSDLTTTLYDVYSNKSRRCLIIVSAAYLRKAWPKHELRAAYTRMVKDGVGYILPIIVDDSQPPKELETISYLRLSDTDVEQVGQRLADRIWEEVGNDWLAQDDLAEVLSSEFRFDTMMRHFRDAAEKDISVDDALCKIMLGLMWTAEKTVRPVEAFFEHLLFDFEPLSRHFDEQEEYLAIPPDGRVRRWIGENGSLLMHQAFWKPIFDVAKAENPLFADTKEEEIESEEQS